MSGHKGWWLLLLSRQEVTAASPWRTGDTPCGVMAALLVGHLPLHHAYSFHPLKRIFELSKNFSHQFVPLGIHILCARNPTPAGFLVRICHWKCLESRVLTEETPKGGTNSGFRVCSIENLLWTLRNLASGTYTFSFGRSVLFINSLCLFNCLLHGYLIATIWADTKTLIIVPLWRDYLLKAIEVEDNMVFAGNINRCYVDYLLWATGLSWSGGCK